MIILINGPMNSGKTTVAKLLAGKLPRTAHVEKLRQFIQWMSIEDSIPFNMKNIISLTRNFVEGGLNVVISYPVSNENFKLISKEIGQKIHAFTLSPRLEVVTKNRGSRELAEWEVEQINKNYQEGLQNPGYGIVIDNSEQTPEETVAEIMSYLPETK